jgi:hypothetical protein
VTTTATYTVTYDRLTSKHWSSDPDVNTLYLRTMRNYANDQLRAHGFVLLNEVLRELGLPRTSKGATDGWLLSTGNEIEFNPSEPDDEGAITLTFNTDGVVYDKIDEIEAAS